MNHAFARVKRHTSRFFKLLSDSDLFIPVSDSLPAVDYDPDHNLDEGSWFRIQRFSQEKYFPPWLQTNLDSKDHSNITAGKYADIKFFFEVRDGDWYFQRVAPSHYIRGKRFLDFGEGVRITEPSHMLRVKDHPDAVYFSESDLLVFRNLADVRVLFPGIEVLYKEATEEEVAEFLQQSFVNLAGGFNIAKVSQPNRRRITIAREALEMLQHYDSGQVVEYIRKYCRDTLRVNTECTAFEISSDDDLKHLLYGIDQRYYTTELSQEMRLANSVQKLS